MKKKKITYGVYNIIEWHAALAIGKAKVRVSFTGGAVTTNGVTPATFTTSDPIVQLAIQRSKEFTSGKIKIVRSNTLQEEVAIERNVKAPAKKASESTQMNSKTNGGTITDESPVSEDTPVSKETEAEALKDSEEMSVESETFDVVTAAEEKEVPIGAESVTEELTKSFAVNDDAKDYLVEEFGFIRSKLRTREDIIKAGKSRGVNIVFGV